MRFETSRKFKSVNHFLYFTLDYTPKKKAALHCLCKYVGDVSEKYPEKRDMAARKDDLYGTDVYCSYKAYGGLLTLFVHHSFLSPRFSKDVSLQEYLDFFKEVFFHVSFSQSSFEEYRRNIIDNISRRDDNPIRYSFNRVLQDLAKEDPVMAVYDYDYIKELEELTLRDVTDVYEEVLHCSSVDQYLYGDLSEEEASLFELFKGKEKHPILETQLYRGGVLPEKIERKDIHQSCLSLVYKTPYHYLHEDFYAWLLGNAFFGIVPTSLLFEEIREKHSLCYNIRSLDYKQHGLIVVRTEIEEENAEEVKRLVEKEIRRLQEGDYEQEELDSARLLLKNTIRSIRDDLSALSDFYHLNLLLRREITIEEYERGLDSVRKEDISRVFHAFSPVYTHLLTGVSHEAL